MRNFLVVIVTMLLSIQIVISYGPSFAEKELNLPELQKLPAQMGSWVAVGEEAMDPNVEAYLRPDEYIIRNYRGGDGASNINLFVAYFKSINSGYGPHSPSVCLPGSGWLTRMQKSVALAVPGKSGGIPVNEYALEKNGEQILVLYWYQNGRRVWADELRSKLFLAPDLVRYRRSDVALVRVIAFLGRDQSIDMPLVYSTDFIKDLFPRLAQRLASTG